MPPATYRRKLAPAWSKLRRFAKSARLSPKKIYVGAAATLPAALLWLLTNDLATALAYGSLTGLLVLLAFVLVDRERLRLNPLLPIVRTHGRTKIRFRTPRRIGPLVAGMASIPERSAALRQATASIINQVDHLYVYLNNYQEVPAYLQSPKITVYRSQDYGDIADNGKFFGLQNHSKGIYFTLDDDIVYPRNYVRTLVRALRQINYAGVVGVHGVYYAKAPHSFLDRRLIHYARGNYEIRPVSLLGTGTAAFPIRLLDLNLDVFKTQRMADVWLAKHAKDRRIPMFAVARPEGWLGDAHLQDPDSSIWLATKANHAHATEVIVENRPWGLDDLFTRVRRPGLPRRFSRKWSAFTRFNERLMADGVESAVASMRNQVPVGDYIAFYCEPSITLATAKAAFAMEGASSKLFRRCAAAAMSYDPVEAGELYERALHDSVATKKRKDIAYFASGAAKAFRWAGEFPRAAAVLEIGLSKQEDSPDLISELIDLYIDRRMYAEARDVYLAKSHLLPKNASYHFRLALATMHSESPEAAAPWITEFFLAPASRRLQGKLISHLRAFYSEEKATFANTASYSFLERACIQGGLDPLPVIHLNLALGDRNSAARLLEQTRPAIAERRPSYMPILDAAVADNFDDAIDQLNVALEASGFTRLELAPADGAQLPLSRLRGRAPRVERNDLISVIMTTYNCEDTVGYAIDSILNQSARNLQLIVVDDCSTDRTAQVIKRYAERDSRVISLRSDVNSGPYVCRNIGLRHAEGVYIAIQDSDDYAHSQRLEYQLQMMRQRNWVASYVGHVRVADDGGLIPDNHGELVGEGPMTLMMRRQVVEELGYFTPVRSRGDVEHRDRMVAYYGAHRVGLDDSVLLFARDSMVSNSRVFDADPTRLGIVPATKALARRRHRDAMGDRELLYVSDVQPDSAPEPPANRSGDTAERGGLKTTGSAPAESLESGSISVAKNGSGKRNRSRSSSGTKSVNKPITGMPDAPLFQMHGRLGPIVQVSRKIKGQYRRPLKRAYLESGELLDKLKTIRHPNLMTVYDYDDDYVYVEYIDGLVLSNRSPFCPPQHTDCYIDHVDEVDLTPIKDAILHLHANGIAHSDVTSHNIMVTKDGTLKLIDLTCCLPPRKDFLKRDLMMYEDLEKEIQAALDAKIAGASSARA